MKHSVSFRVKQQLNRGERTRCCCRRRTRKEYIDILRELRRKHPDVDMPSLESMAAAEVLNRGPKSRAFYRIQATRKLTGGGNIIRRRAPGGRRESVIDDTAFATTVDDDVTRLFFEPGHYTVFENVGSCQLTVVRQVSHERTSEKTKPLRRRRSVPNIYRRRRRRHRV